MQLARRCLWTVVLVLALVTTASAQGMAGKFAVTPQVGLVYPIGDFADTDTTASSGGAKPSFTFGGSGEYYFTDNIAVGGKFNYNRFGFDEAVYGELAPGTEVDGKWTIMEFGIFIKYLMMPENATRLFGRAGVIYGKADLEGDITYEGTTYPGEADISAALGIEAAVGVTHMVADNIGLFGEVSFVHHMTDGKDMTITDPLGTRDDEEAEGNNQWFGVRSGASFFFGGE